jgi:outer membrane protein OmpA-like peptidoglycan-associated protein
MLRGKRIVGVVAATGLILLLSGCAMFQQQKNEERVTSRDKTKKGAAIGAVSGAVLGAVIGEGELDEILAGAAIGAGIGAGIGVYMDRQEEKLAQIPGTTVERVGPDMLLVHFDSDVLFSINSANLNELSRTALDDASDVFNEFPKTAIIAQGHTDSSGSESHNLSLSEMRAKSVANHLMMQGIHYTRITAVGYGEGHPVASNNDAVGRSMNRRVDLLLKAKAR